MIKLHKKQFAKILQKFNNNDEDLNLIKHHIQRSVSISWIKQTWENFYGEFILKKCIYNNVSHEYEGYSTLKFTTMIHDDLLYWWNEIKHSIRFFRIDHAELAEYSGLSHSLSIAIYNYHYQFNFNVENKLSDCKKMTHDDWQKILAFVRTSYYILHQLNEEKPLTIYSFKKNAVYFLEEIIKKHSCMTIQFYVRIFLFKRQKARRLVQNFIFKHLFLPDGILFKYYKRRFYQSSFFFN